ncbi:MAG: penicillin-binding protein 2 [Thermoleophilia bacterium]|nr:penicillin-binding protein 2 [Thermoleophilia bacterium]
MTRRESNRRIRMLGALVMAGVGLMALRALWVGGVRADALSTQARNQQERTFAVPAERGIIEDRSGMQLASDKPTATVSATPYLVTDPADTAAALARVLKVPAKDIESKLRDGGGYAVIAKGVEQDVAKAIRDEELTGIDVEDTWTRYLPQGRLAAQVVGLVGDEGGQGGVEAALDTELTGTPGVREISRDPLGHTLRTLHQKEPVRGTTVRLSLDSATQLQVERILAETRKRFGAKSASAVVMRPQDGAILAMASVPRFNPNDRTRYVPELVRNRPSQDIYEPGSTFKIVAIAGAIEDGKVTPATRFNVPETITLFDRPLRDSHNEGATTWSVGDILERSSNKGTVLIAQRLGAEAGKAYLPGTPDSDRRLSEWITRFGFGSKTGIDVPGEESGRIPDIDKYPEEWSGTSILNIPIGQGVLVTELQTARAYAAIANGGRLVTPHVVAKVGGRKVEHPAGRRVISWKTSRKMDAMLRKAVSAEGTGSAAEVPGYDVAGKTGTANKIDPKTGKYSQTRYVASFVGYVPAGNPQLLIAVTVDEPQQQSIFGGDVAAPAFSRIAQFSLLRMEIPPA